MDKVLVVVGPTGVGKTKLSVALAKLLDGEIISGDSMQVYQGMDIGTAKITEEEMQGVSHYLVDCYAFDEDYNVKIFQEQARTYVEEIKDKEKLPIICGGTGLYIKSMIYDYQFLNQPENEHFMQFLQERSEDELWSMLELVDKKTADTLHKHNRQRVIRALCMAHDGQKKSDLLDKQEHQPIYDAYIIGLTMDRTRLYERINQRVDDMIEQGLKDEIEKLYQQKQKSVWELQSFQGIGYKEWKGYFEEQEGEEACIEKIKKNSRNFAKRQYTWFKNQMDVHWYDVEEAGYEETIIKDVKEWLKKI